MITWKTLGQQVLTATAASVYTVPSSTQTAVHAAALWNPTASPVVCDVFMVPVSGTAADATHVDRVTVSATSSGTFFNLINQKLGPGAQLFALGNGVTFTVSGAESV